MFTGYPFKNCVLLVFNIIGHAYVLYTALPATSIVLSCCLLCIMTFPLALLIRIRLYAAIHSSSETNRFESLQSQNKYSDELNCEIQPSDTDIEGPPRIPLRSAPCPEMGGILVFRLIAETTVDHSSFILTFGQI
jgi:hypothetical protein